MTIYRIINRSNNRTAAKRGPKPKIGPREDTRIKRVVRKRRDQRAQCTSRILQEECGLQHVSRRTVQRALKRNHFEYKSASKLIQLSAAHKDRRIAAIKRWTRDDHNWAITAFTDEKRFSLDGPDSWSSYTDHAQPLVLNRRQNHGGGIMLWGMLCPPNFLYLLRMDGTFNSSAYCSQILDQAVPFMDDMYGSGNWILQQDNCAIHVSRETRAHLESLNCRTFDWPARSPDLNIIENVWSMMVEIVYKEKAQYNSKQELWEAIEKAVEEININRTSDIEKLYASIRTRHILVMEKRGGTIDY